MLAADIKLHRQTLMHTGDDKRSPVWKEMARLQDTDPGEAIAQGGH